MPGKLVDVKGIRVHLYCTGSGNPTVLVVGGGFSVDWGLVQPAVAQFTRICTYDPTGTAWSDPAKSEQSPGCSSRVSELSALVDAAKEHDPYVLVGFSIGGLIARLYAARYPSQTAGLVIVDHAFLGDNRGTAENTLAKPSTNSPNNAADRPPALILQTPIDLGIEDDASFQKLPASNRELHRWALKVSTRPTPEMVRACSSEVLRAEERDYPLGSKPLAVVSTLYESPSYQELQKQLLSLSRNSSQFVAANSTHMVLVDQPEIIVKAIRAAVDNVRSSGEYKSTGR